MQQNNNQGTTEFKRELGLPSAIGIVVGNMIATGIFMAPQGLAVATNPKAAVLAWIITTIGSILLALSFAKMGSAIPATGGPLVYSRVAFGDFAGFLIAWTYWIGAWVGNSAIITGAMSYLTYFFPILSENRLLAFLISSGFLWFFTIINIRGVKGAGIVGIVTTICKIIPLIIFAVIAAIHFDITNFSTVSSPELNSMKTLPAAVGITLWSYVGLECATVPAGEIKDPERNIKLSTIIGILITAVVYVSISVLAIGAMPQENLASSGAPLAEIINFNTNSSWGGTLIAVGAIISALGATSGWILITARSSFAAAEEEIFPDFFAKIHPKFKTPHVSLIVAGVCSNILLIMNYVGSMQAAFNFMILLATLAFLPAYSFTAAAEMLLLKKDPGNFNFYSFMKNSFVALLAFAYSIYAIYGTGATVVMYGFLLMLIGIPLYVYMIRKNKNE